MPGPASPMFPGDVWAGLQSLTRADATFARLRKEAREASRDLVMAHLAGARGDGLSGPLKRIATLAAAASAAAATIDEPRAG